MQSMAIGSILQLLQPLRHSCDLYSPPGHHPHPTPPTRRTCHNGHLPRQHSPTPMQLSSEVEPVMTPRLRHARRSRYARRWAGRMVTCAHWLPCCMLCGCVRCRCVTDSVGVYCVSVLCWQSLDAATTCTTAQCGMIELDRRES